MKKKFNVKLGSKLSNRTKIILGVTIPLIGGAIISVVSDIRQDNLDTAADEIIEGVTERLPEMIEDAAETVADGVNEVIDT